MKMNLDLDVLRQIADTSSRLEKLILLKRLDAGKELLALSLDPNVTFGVTADEDAWADQWQNVQITHRDTLAKADWDDAFAVMVALSQRKITGNAAISSVEFCATRLPSVEHARVFARLINKDLRAGFQISSVLKTWPGIIEPFTVQLAQPYDHAKHELNGEWYLDPKLDGLRMVVIDGVAYSRSGKVINSVDHVTDELKKMGLTKDFVFDGEIMGGGQFDEASGKVRRKSVKATDAVYHVFDLIKAEEWAAKKTEPLEARRRRLHSSLAVTSEFIQVVPYIRVYNPTNRSLVESRDEFIKLGYEGVMLKDALAPYQFKRSKHLLKFKEFASEDCEILDMVEGKGKYRNMMGTLVIDVGNGVRCEVGTGFDDNERKEFWENKNDYIGRVVEVLHQEPRTAEGRLRFPAYMRLRPDKD